MPIIEPAFPQSFIIVIQFTFSVRQEKRCHHTPVGGRQMFNPIQDTTKHRVDSCLRALSHVGFDNHQTGFGYCLGHTDGLTLHWT